MTTEPRTLAQMQHRPTSYEVAYTYQGATVRLGFTQRKTKAVLLSMARTGGHVLACLGAWDGEAQYSSTIGWTFGPVRVHFTGRTERDLATA